MQELLLKRYRLFFLHFFTNCCESLKTHMIIFACPHRKFRPKKRDSLQKFHRTYGLPLESYLSDRTNHYRKCPTAIGEHCYYYVAYCLMDYYYVAYCFVELYFDEWPTFFLASSNNERRLSLAVKKGLLAARLLM